MGTWGRSQWAHLVCTQGSPEGVRVKIDCSALPEIFVCWQGNSFQEVQKSVQ